MWELHRYRWWRQWTTHFKSFVLLISQEGLRQGDIHVIISSMVRIFWGVGSKIGGNTLRATDLQRFNSSSGCNYIVLFVFSTWNCMWQLIDSQWMTQQRHTFWINREHVQGDHVGSTWDIKVMLILCLLYWKTHTRGNSIGTDNDDDGRGQT